MIAISIRPPQLVINGRSGAWSRSASDAEGGGRPHCRYHHAVFCVPGCLLRATSKLHSVSIGPLKPTLPVLERGQNVSSWPILLEKAAVADAVGSVIQSV
jgi:hypothetical protein